jgi:hypothetical protein
MHEYDLLAVWFRVADWAAYDLSKDGSEGLVLKPLGQHSKAATFIARLVSQSSVYRYRKIAAGLTGWIKQPPLDLLAVLLQQESERDKALPKDDWSRLDCQSVLEDIVFSGAFWARNEPTRAAGFELLRSVVERTISGEYWNTASYAMTTLCRHQAPGCSELLNRFEHFANHTQVEHPSRPSFEHEKQFAQNLLAEDPKTLEVIESSLNQREEAAKAELDENSRSAVVELVKFAERFDAGQYS